MTTNTTLTAAQQRRQAQLNALRELTCFVADDLLGTDAQHPDDTRATISESINRLLKLNYAIYLVSNQQDEDSELFIKRLMENEWQPTTKIG